MPYTTLITAAQLAQILDDCVLVDCRHDLFDAEAGRRGYDQAHIPGAFFLHQDRDLAGPKDGRNGRHPLPARAAVRDLLARLGLADGRQLVAYDTSAGQMAGRVWWLARWIGHAEVALLDGGLAAWIDAGLPLTADVAPAPRAGALTLRASLAPSVSTAEILAALGRAAPKIVDARAPERYRGETEPLDPVAGHIPGALNRPIQSNLLPDGRFKPAAALRAEFAELLGDVAPSAVVHHCGSGIAACHNVIAMEHAGLGGSLLYPGSWSEWCADPARPVATGSAA